MFGNLPSTPTPNNIEEPFMLTMAPHFGEEESNKEEPAFDALKADLREKEYQLKVHQEAFRNDSFERTEVEREALFSKWGGRVIHVKGIEVGLVEWARVSGYVFGWARQSTLGDDGEEKKKKRPLVLHLPDHTDGAVRWLKVMISSPPSASPCPPPDAIIGVLELARFLQCENVTNVLGDIVASSIDENNVLTIVQMAWRLELHELYKQSVAFTNKKYDDVKTHPFYGSMPSTLKQQICAMQALVRSSVIGRGQQNDLVFSSSNEFIAIFSDSIREQKERVTEARRRNEEVNAENAENFLRRVRRRFTGTEHNAYTYNQELIEKQEERIKTLETFLAEQKTIFGASGGGDPFVIFSGA